MSLLIIKPTAAEKAYDLAADIFAEMYEKVTGTKIAISETDDGVSDIIAIGSDAVNDLVMNDIFEGAVGDLNIRYGTDDYCMRSYKKCERNVLVLAGGRGRSAIYAVYDYFERFAGCRYFFDGDVIPHAETICTKNIDVCESPRFEYRGLRYFAHRGLKRFQAEHWSFDDWKQEIDWIMKKRLNFFMLRIGMDDAWQRAFPNDVHYPEDYNIENEKGYDDRSDFWTLKYRGELRIRVMQYARDNDIMSPTDCGTMTHWYSKTPVEFLEAKNPKFLEQADNQYMIRSTRVFDFRERENMDYYIQLTKTMAEQYDDNNYLFHTIGLGERRIYKENSKNFMLKKLCYRRIMQRLRQEYPNSKMLLASWDFVGWWQPHEVQEFIKELDPERTIIFDYTSDGFDKLQNFESWGVVNKFPWIFGLFHAYELESELRGAYDRTDEKLKIAADDPYCKGLIFWPELSHSDPIILEYLSSNAWAPFKYSVEQLIENYCTGRYGMYGAAMNDCWQKFLPFMKLGNWVGYRKIENNETATDSLGNVKTDTDRESFATDSMWAAHTDMWTYPDRYKEEFKQSTHAEFYRNAIDETKKVGIYLPEVMRNLANINAETDDIFIKRDSTDIARTVCGRLLNYMYANMCYRFKGKEYAGEIRTVYMQTLRALADLLSHNSDFSMYDTLCDLQKTAPVNPKFEYTLKQNISNSYCRQYCTELIDSIFIPENDAVLYWFEGKMSEADERKLGEDAVNKFMDTPLKDLKRVSDRHLSEIMTEIADLAKSAVEML